MREAVSNSSRVNLQESMEELLNFQDQEDYFHNEIKNAVVNEWKQRESIPIDITISEEGVKMEQ